MDSCLITHLYVSFLFMTNIIKRRLSLNFYAMIPPFLNEAKIIFLTFKRFSFSFKDAAKIGDEALFYSHEPYIIKETRFMIEMKDRSEN